MKLKRLYEDYRSGPTVFPIDCLDRAQSYKGPTDNYPKKSDKKCKNNKKSKVKKKKQAQNTTTKKGFPKEPLNPPQRARLT